MSTRKIQVPVGDGTWQEIEAEVIPGSQVNADKQAAATGEAFLTEAATLTQKMAQFANCYAGDYSLVKEQVVFAIALLCVNMREHYPDGKGRFDELASSASDYYDQEAKKSGPRK